jgi:hypothetical protein
MFDVFYSGIKPGLFVHEREARDIEHARSQSRARYFWWVNYLCDYTGWDFLWEPVPWEQQFTHTWPSQHHEYSGTYLVPTNVETIEYRFHTEIIPNRNSQQHYQVVVPGAEFDWSWHPHPLDPPYIYVFGNQWWPANKMPTVEYHVPGATERKYMNLAATLSERHTNHWHTIIDCTWDYSWVPDPGDPPYIYVFGNQWHRAEVMPTVEYHVPGAIERKYLPWPRAELLPDQTLWSVPKEINPADVDFTWVPDPGSPPYIYQFGTQHQRTGGPQYCVPGAIEIKYVDQIRARTDRVATAVYEIDHMDNHAGSVPNTTRIVRYFDNYLDTLRRIANGVAGEHEFIWICSSVCDYTDFDFTWHPEQWQATMLHVFPSDSEKFGDTFFMHVPTFLYRAEKCQLLEWYDLNFTNISVPRRPMPVIVHDYDSQADAAKTIEFAGPLALFTVNDYVDGNLITVPLWREKTKTVVPVSDGAGSVVIPKTAIPYIKKQLYDYPYIDKTQRMLKDSPLDIVFISNGEGNADMNWNYLEKRIVNLEENRLVRVDGVKGRVASYHAAAEASTTEWFFAVFAKLEIDYHFDWRWQPDRMQEPKHYIFHAKNSINGLVYGHQAMIAYNKKLVLANPGVGLDFTLDSPHEVVPILSGTANYGYSDWMCWRTAFREVLKLKSALPDVEAEYRLRTWLTPTFRSYAKSWKWSHIGAEDAAEYYDEVGGDFDALRKSYDWDWLSSYAFLKHSLLPDQ